jgi:phenylacetate-CoA ligase
MNRYNLPFSDFEPASLDAMWRRLRSLRPYLVHGHPSTMYWLAVRVHALGDRGPPAFRVFESSGELLKNYQRDMIAQVFECEVVDRYGLAEVGIAAYQADRNDRAMLVNDPLVWPEIAPLDEYIDNSADEQDESGEIVVTTSKNRMMPLIRYRTGDMAVLSESPSGFVLSKLVGRIHDVIEIGGRKLPTHYIQDVLDRIGGIREFQVELRGDGPVIRLVPERDANVDNIRAQVDRFWNNELKIEFIDASELQLLGWRRKFRRIVEATDAPAAHPIPAL